LIDVSVRVEISSVRGSRLETGKTARSSGPVKFDVSARLEEKERRSGQIVVFFGLSVGTKPSLVKFELEGYATLIGKDEALSKMLEIDPKTGVPFVFHRVYQHSFTTIYLLATLMDTIYPPPDLLFSGERRVGAGTIDAKSEDKEVQSGDSVQSAQQAPSGSENQKW